MSIMYKRRHREGTMIGVYYDHKTSTKWYVCMDCKVMYETEALAIECAERCHPEEEE